MGLIAWVGSTVWPDGAGHIRPVATADYKAWPRGWPHTLTKTLARTVCPQGLVKEGANIGLAPNTDQNACSSLARKPFKLVPKTGQT